MLTYEGCQLTKLKAKRVFHSFWLNLALKVCAKFNLDKHLINYLILSYPTFARLVNMQYHMTFICFVPR
jgi:hypothetical protein